MSDELHVQPAQLEKGMCQVCEGWGAWDPETGFTKVPSAPGVTICPMCHGSGQMPEPTKGAR